MTVIYPSPIFGPVHSRRLGVSLGINLLPSDGKVCSFDCIYCECGFNADHRPSKALPTREEVREALETRLKDMQVNGPFPDVLTFVGNGEPTAHPHFPEIIEDTLALRDKYFPNAKVSVLSNSTFIHRPAEYDHFPLLLSAGCQSHVYQQNRRGYRPCPFRYLYPSQPDCLHGRYSDIRPAQHNLRTHRYVQLRHNVLAYKVFGSCGHLVRGTYTVPGGQHRAINKAPSGSFIVESFCHLFVTII